jgi:hypothetical protein
MMKWILPFAALVTGAFLAAAYLACGPDTAINCTPECEGKECGPDGCGGTCGTCDFKARECTEAGRCEGPCWPNYPVDCGFDNGCWEHTTNCATVGFCDPEVCYACVDDMTARCCRGEFLCCPPGTFHCQDMECYDNPMECEATCTQNPATPCAF